VSVEMSKLLSKEVKMHINDVKDFRNYKVSIQHAKLTLGFTPAYTVKDIIHDLFQHAGSISNMESDKYYNIKIFESLGKI